MLMFKCKMCGGTLEVNNNETVGVCEYCGTKQTLPKLDNERKMNLYDRANHFRRNDEFDKAMSIYEQILNEDRTDAESYWSIVLCRYGIEYVEDPTTHKRIPTVNRTQLTSIFDDEDYKSALQYADGYQREIYENEANAINEIQKGILAISQKEEPFDVFICYKETDKSGRRTQDSVLAQQLYYELVEEGFKVFFAKITLEDKLGQEYEPYIFAALNSAKVMVVLGTKPEHFNAVWVKNEWSRYLALIKKGESKMLIPAYRDMDPYDLPEEFSHLQAQDMEKLGFMQDLVRGIKKIVQVDITNTDAKAPVAISGNANTSALLRRAYLFLEDGDWENADEYCEKVLDFEPENANAYLGKLMVELKVKKQEALKDCAQPFDDKNNYQKVLRFADATLASTLKEDNDYIKERNENARLEGIYTSAVDKMQFAMKERHYKDAAEEFHSIGEYKDSVELFRRCLEQAEVARKDDIYLYAKTRMVGDILGNYEEAIHQFQFIPDWKDSQEQIIECQRKIEEIKEEQEKQRKDDIYNNALIKYNANSISDIEEAVALLESIPDWRDSRTKIAEYRYKIKEVQEENKRKKRKRTLIEILSILVAAAIIPLIIVLVEVVIPNNKYEKAISLSEREQYDEAIALLSELNDYKDSNALLVEAKYEYAIECLDEKQFQKSFDLLTEVKDYKEASEILKKFEFVLIKEIRDKYSVVEYSYDEKGQLLKELTKDSSGDEAVVEYTYGDNGKKTKVASTNFDGSWEIIEYTYDVDGHCLTRVEKYSNGIISTREYSYDTRGKRIKEEEKGLADHVTIYSYNQEGKCIKEESKYSSGTSSATVYSYDSQGNLLKEVKSYSYGDDQVTEYTYDEQGKCLTKKNSYSGITERYTYDEHGNLLTETTGNTTAVYSYDDYGNCIKFYHPNVSGEEYTKEYIYTVIYKE